MKRYKSTKMLLGKAHTPVCVRFCEYDLEHVILCRQAKDRFLRLKKERDYHRMHHRRVIQEKGKLMRDIQQLKDHCTKYENALSKIQQKYEVVNSQVPPTSMLWFIVFFATCVFYFRAQCVKRW